MWSDYSGPIEIYALAHVLRLFETGGTRIEHQQTYFCKQRSLSSHFKILYSEINSIVSVS